MVFVWVRLGCRQHVDRVTRLVRLDGWVSYTGSYGCIAHSIGHQDLLDLFAAGTTCISWSRFGLKDGWVAPSALPFGVARDGPTNLVRTQNQRFVVEGSRVLKPCFTSYVPRCCR